MADFFTEPPGYPELPDAPDTPLPNLDDLAKNTISALGKSGPVGGWAVYGINFILRVLAMTVAWFLSALLFIFSYVVKFVGNVTNDASSNYGTLIAAMLEELFGVEVNPASVNTRRGGPDRQQVATNLGKAVIGTLFGSAKPNAGGGITPSSDAADSYLAVVMNMELNGWIEGWVADGMSAHLLEKFGDLKDGISRTLGLGRMSRQVFQPPLKVLVHDPYLALLNQRYRPRAADVQAIMRAFHRGQVARPKLSELLGNMGYTEEEIGWLITDHVKSIPDSDIDYLVARGTWTHTQATDYLRQQGWGDADSQYVLQIASDRRVQKYREEFVHTGVDAFVRGEIDQPRLESIVQTSGLPSDEQSWITQNAVFRREVHPTHLSRGDIETGILDGVLNFNDLQAWAVRNNMPIDQERFLELMVLFRQNKITVAEHAKQAAAKAKAEAAEAKLKLAQEKATQAKAEAADRGLSIAQAEALVRAGDWTFQQLTAFLTSKGYGPDAIAAVETLLHHDMDKAKAAAPTRGSVSTAAKAKGLSLAEMEKAVIAGILTIPELTNWLHSAGFSETDTAVVVELTERALTDAQTRAATKAAAAAAAGKHSAKLVDVERAVRLNITPIETYAKALDTAGYDDASKAILMGVLRAQLAQDAAKKVPATPTTPAATTKALSLGQLEQERLAGLITPEQYQTALTGLGYSAGDVAHLVELTRLKGTHSTTATALHSDAAGKAVAVGINLSQAEAAVVAGINSFESYDAMLTRLGYDDVDRHTLEALLLKRIEAAAAKDAKAAGTGPEVPA